MQGVDEAYDAAVAGIAQAEQGLKDFLQVRPPAPPAWPQQCGVACAVWLPCGVPDCTCQLPPCAPGPLVHRPAWPPARCPAPALAHGSAARAPDPRPAPAPAPAPVYPPLPQEARKAVGGGVRVQFVSLNKESHVMEVPEVRRAALRCSALRCEVVRCVARLVLLKHGGAAASIPLLESQSTPCLTQLHARHVLSPTRPQTAPNPQSATVPASWEPVSGKKGFKRYTCAALKELVRKERRTAWCLNVPVLWDSWRGPRHAARTVAGRRRHGSSCRCPLALHLLAHTAQVRAREAAYDAKERAQGGILQVGAAGPP